MHTTYFYRVNYLYNEPVWVDDQHQWQSVDEDTVYQNVWTAEPVLGEIVSTAGSHVAFWNVSVPAKEWQNRPDTCMDPDEQNS